MQAKHFFSPFARIWFMFVENWMKLREYCREKKTHSFSTFWFNVTLWNEETMLKKITAEAVKNEIFYRRIFRFDLCLSENTRE